MSMDTYVDIQINEQAAKFTDNVIFRQINKQSLHFTVKSAAKIFGIRNRWTLLGLIG
jgi:hypothetical protein